MGSKWRCSSQEPRSIIRGEIFFSTVVLLPYTLIQDTTALHLETKDPTRARQPIDPSDIRESICTILVISSASPLYVRQKIIMTSKLDGNEKNAPSRFQTNLKNLFLIAIVFLSFIAIAIWVIPHLPALVGFIFYSVGALIVGTFLGGLAK